MMNEEENVIRSVIWYMGAQAIIGLQQCITNLVIFFNIVTFHEETTMRKKS